MFKTISLNTRFFTTSCSMILFFTIIACSPAKNIPYFEGAKEGQVSSDTPLPESVIQKNDILSITISDLNPEASKIFNQANMISSSNAGGSATTVGTGDGYLVNGDGNIQLPLLGNIKAEGLTKTQLKESIRKNILDKKLLLDPIVSIRFLNFRITVLGEVNRPTVVTVPSEKISLLEAIGLAGDLTLYGKRENVLIIREHDGQRVIKRINLNSSELFTSTYYYLQSNDIVYVEPNKTKLVNAKNVNTAQWLPAFFSALSVAAIVADRLIK